MSIVCGKVQGSPTIVFSAVNIGFLGEQLRIEMKMEMEMVRRYWCMYCSMQNHTHTHTHTHITHTAVLSHLFGKL